MKQRDIHARSKPSLHVGPAASEVVGDRLNGSLDRFRQVGAHENADLFILSRQEMEDMVEDALAEAAHARTRDQESVPQIVLDRLIAGESPVKVWREHRALTLATLAEKAGMGKGYLSQIENRRRRGTVATLQKLAAVLAVELDDLSGG
jgi:DNA-binding XRE family transcriptional regulator